MFAKSTTFASLFLSSSYLLAQAVVTPSEPGPGDVFNAGSTCRIVWSGDRESTTVWKDMAIELMTGSNTGMVHLTTVATGQDGTVDGSFEYPCPEMDPYSAIYFYQFTSPLSPTESTQWTTRFTIASASGETVPPSESTQPNGDSIPWGTGALADPSTAVAAPVFGGSGVATSDAGVAGTNSAVTSPAAAQTTLATTSVPPTTSTTLLRTSTAEAAPTPSRASDSTNTSDNSNNGVATLVVLGAPMTTAAGVLAAGAAVFAFML